ncbi:PH domain-containing protein [Mucilaginibacter sp. UR6-11]|uniref:PH domain-containing protein n=1 Tax=Mucilaginibacter sp. UR6-11 TaxID=1435644 RepID=UPI001E31A418|nr:PH domain-containing protein [Mucilaginibacter sp. UR6-11]MCC8426909.1 PH domain-containing protein [Mucilaginibacter sp. UR6-11]
MVYKSKIGPAIWVTFGILPGGLSVFYIANHIWDALAIIAIVAAFTVYLIVTTYYTIIGNILNVHCGFFYNTDIDIANIKSITETNSALSAPALSLDRIEILYNKYDSIVISPPNKTEFITALKAINGDIQIKLKAKKISKLRV